MCKFLDYLASYSKDNYYFLCVLSINQDSFTWNVNSMNYKTLCFCFNVFSFYD